jgi:hypothetical protein
MLGISRERRGSAENFFLHKSIHKAQILSYLKLTGCPIGLLINFNVELLKECVRQMVNNFSENLMCHNSLCDCLASSAALRLFTG